MAINTKLVIILVLIGAVIIIVLLVILGVVLYTFSGKKNNTDETGSEGGGGFNRVTQKCTAEPPKFFGLFSDWNGKNKKISTIVHYRCGFVSETPVAKAVQCQSPEGWRVIYTDLRACYLDAEGKAMREKMEKQIAFTGCYRSEPPAAGRYFRDWNRLRWELGTTIKYKCSAQKNSPLVKTVVCQKYRKWKVTEEKKVSCECNDLPPDHDQHKDKLVWDPSVKWMGTIIGYRCSDNPNSKFWKLLQCDVNGKWVVTETRSCV